jgi:acyl CoA:acetate/3-ketoacid CoA transferase beta subunit
MDFADDSRRMRLRSLHPGITTDTVIKATGFDLIIPESVPETTPPSAAELEVLRTRVDREGRLRR